MGKKDCLKQQHKDPHILVFEVGHVSDHMPYEQKKWNGCNEKIVKAQDVKMVIQKEKHQVRTGYMHLRIPADGIPERNGSKDNKRGPKKPFAGFGRKEYLK